MAQRREAREAVLEALYAEDVGKGEVEFILKNNLKHPLKEDREAYKFAEQLFLKVLNHDEELNEVISSHIDNWQIHRLAVIDKLLLRMAICEFIYFEEIPTKVTMNEAIELGKKYSTSKSGRFINGILDSAMEDLKADGRIQKTGRGLIETNINSNS